MKTKKIPQPIAEAAAAMLAPYCPGLNAAKLSEALSTPSADAETLLTKKEVMARLKISPRTLDRMLEPGGPLARLRVGGSVRIRESEVLALIEGVAA